MQNRTIATPALGALLLATLFCGTAVPSLAQTTKPSSGKMAEHQGGMAGMSGMMSGPHHALAMAYRDNLTTFAKALRADVSQSHSVNLDLARPAAAEMRRSFDQMVGHHKEHLAAPGTHMNTAMTGRMKEMDAHIGALREHLAALETEVAGSAPRPAQVTMHTAAILKECAGMSTMHAKAKPHQMK